MRPGPADAFRPLLDELGTPELTATIGTTRALLVVHRGELVVERYGDGTDATTTLPSWSMAKSILHAAVGVLVGRGELDPAAPADLSAWRNPGDPRGGITVDHLLHMRSGLAWTEDYVAGHASDVQEMLFGPGRADVAGYAADRPLAHAPGSRFCYSSGESNLLSEVVAQAVGGGDRYEGFLRSALFDPLGMTSAVPKFDARGTWIASSYCFATARDFARFGLLYLRDGVWDGVQLLPPGWVDHGRRPQPDAVDDGWIHGAHWWSLPEPDDGLFFASGYRGQRLVVVPGRDLVIVRCGDSEPAQADPLTAWLDRLIRCVEPISRP